MDHKPEKRFHRNQFFPSSGISLYVIDMENHQPEPFHDHDFSELVIVTRGSGKHITRFGAHEIAAGDVFVLHEREMHAYENVHEFALYNILYDFTDMQLPSFDMAALAGYQALFSIEPQIRTNEPMRHHLRLKPDELAHAQQMVERMQRELIQKTPGYKTACISLFSLLVVALSRYYESLKFTNVDSDTIFRIGKALSYIEGHYTDKLTFDDLAQVAAMSPSTFLRAFRKLMGDSPIEYLIKYRIRKAAELLRSYRTSVTQAALQSGFDNPEYFSRAFKKVLGTTPRKYKESRP
jgi:AraC-like DNA-binding protein